VGLDNSPGLCIGRISVVRYPHITKLDLDLLVHLAVLLEERHVTLAYPAKVMRAIVPGKLQIEAESVPLSEVAGVWNREQPLKRIVFTLRNKIGREGQPPKRCIRPVCDAICIFLGRRDAERAADEGSPLRETIGKSQDEKTLTESVVIHNVTLVSDVCFSWPTLDSRLMSNVVR
jgi:hypothetical protein